MYFKLPQKLKAFVHDYKVTLEVNLKKRSWKNGIPIIFNINFLISLDIYFMLNLFRLILADLIPLDMRGNWIKNLIVKWEKC